jgi:Zn-dependent protease with chaperone function
MAETTTTVPRRSDLIAQMQRANRFAWAMLAFEIALIGVACAIVDWGWVMREPIFTAVAIFATAGPFAKSIAIHWAEKKKRIEDLKEATRFGQFDKYFLQRLFRETLAKLRLPEENLPVYIVANRSMNAAALHVGFGSFLKSLNGIYLNRQVLHKLEPAEVQDLMGHELGHYYKYYLVIDRFRIVTVILGSLFGILAVQLIGLDDWLGYLLLMFVTGSAWWLSSLPYARNATAIEFLCDDFGAQVGGVFASIHGLLKLGLSSEVECVVMQQAILSKVAGNLNPTELIETIFGAIPYGHATREEIEDRVNRELKKRESEKSKSLMGLLRYMWNSDSDADAAHELEEEARKLAKLQTKPRLDWERLLRNPTHIEFDESGMRQLIDLIEAQPERLLFRIPEEPGAVHPPLRTRILYLWHNRSEIETR